MRKVLLIASLVLSVLNVNAQIIKTVAGTGIQGNDGDNGLAINAKIDGNYLALDKYNNMYITGSYTIRKIDAHTGVITTIAGNGLSNFSGDNGLAINAGISSQSCPLAIDPNSDDIYIYDNYRIRKINATTQIITTIAGNGNSYDAGDGGLASAASISGGAIAIDYIGNIYICCSYRIRRIDANSHIITTLIGNGIPGWQSGGIIGQPIDLMIYSNGNITFISGGDGHNYTINPNTNQTTGFNCSYSNIGCNNIGKVYMSYYSDPCWSSDPRKVGIYYIDTSNINPNQLIAGTGVSGYSGDGGLAINAKINNAGKPVCDTKGNIFFIDKGNYRIRKIILEHPTMQGYIFTDDNSNNIFDGNDTYKANIKVQLSNSNYTFTDNNGYYQIQADSIGSYTLTITPPTGYNALPQTVSYSFNTYDTTVSKYIALQQTVTFDSLSVYAVPLVANAVQSGAMPYWVQYENCGTSVLTPTVFLNYSNYILNYDSCSDASAVPYYNGVSTAQTNMQPGQMNNFIAYYDVKPTATVGDTLKTFYGIGVGTTLAASDSFYMLVEGAANADGQRATPSLTPTQVANGKDIYYTINLKNTGNDTAFNVIITDTLSSKLQANTLQMLSSSHKCKTTVKGNLVTFELLNIKLPKASINALRSLGFVSFKIKPKTNLTAGTIITNKANTYYNYRLPISSTAITIVKNVVTPVRVMSYELRLINEKQVLNLWTTATEINTSHFNIQRSFDAKEFKTIGTIAAKGFGDYSFTDNQLPTTTIKLTIYYRLEVVDKDGSKTYSTIKQLVIRNEKLAINIFPNPAKDAVTIESKGIKSVIVTDCFGRVVYKSIVNNPSTIVNLKPFAKGVYIFSFDNGEKVKVEKE